MSVFSDSASKVIRLAWGTAAKGAPHAARWKAPRSRPKSVSARMSCRAPLGLDPPLTPLPVLPQPD